ncbi:blastopia polyprotein [Trichonephila clavipes]|nr:blastopia polyprotein [Trichonephila clavipes]
MKITPLKVLRIDADKTLRLSVAFPVQSSVQKGFKSFRWGGKAGKYRAQSQLNDIIIPATDEKEANKKLTHVLETDENIRNLKKLLPANKTTEFILNDNVLFKISENQELLVVPEMMQVNVIKKAHSFRPFAATKTEELARRDYYFPNMRKCVENVIKNCVEYRLANKKMQEENVRAYHRKRKQFNIRKES